MIFFPSEAKRIHHRWSFVKNSRKYYDDCAQILSEHIIAVLKPAALRTFSTLDPLVTTSINRIDDDFILEVPKRKETFLSRATRMLQGEPTECEDGQEDNLSLGALSADAIPAQSQRTETSELLSNAATTLIEGALPVREFPNNLTSEPASMTQSANSSVGDEKDVILRRKRSSSIQESHQEELRCVLAIVRHGDRTPKQKLKVNMTEPHILQFFHNHVEDCHKDLKVKAKTPMTEFLETVKTTLQELKKDDINDGALRYQLMHMRDILERWKIVGLNRKLQIKPKKFEDYIDDSGETRQRCTEVQLILKWGGNLTKLGEKQSIHLGQRLRHNLYPDPSGGGILRLHSTFRHDLKIKTSDEGRVMKTAAAFAKGLLELEGDLPPILVSLVHKEKGSMHMLDPSGNKEVKAELDECKERITTNLQKDVDVETATEEDLMQLVGPRDITSLRKALNEVRNPRKRLFQIHATMGELLTQLDEMLGEMGSGDEKRLEGEGLEGEAEDDEALSGVKLYKGETLLELTERWRFIYDRLYDAETDKFDLSRVPDVHDNVRFDVLHNTRLGLSNTFQKLYELVSPMAECVVPQEYGTTIEEKRSVGSKICRGLLEKIKYDLGVARTDNEVDMRYMINLAYSADLPINTMGRRIRTRLYFTSESHMHTVLNVLRYGSDDQRRLLLSEKGINIINSTPELCYLTQIIMRVFEDSRFELSDARRFRVEILFSPGATSTPFELPENERDFDNSRFDTEPLQVIGREGLTCQEVEDFFEQAIMAGGTPDDYDLYSTSTMPDGGKVKGKRTEKKVDIAPAELKPEVNESGEQVHTPNRPMQEIRSGETSAISMDDIPAQSSDEGTVTFKDDDRNHPGLPVYESADESPSDNDEKDEMNVESSDGDDIVNDGTLYSRKYFWGAVAVTSFVLGLGCLVMALSLGGEGRQRRRWSTKRY